MLWKRQYRSKISNTVKTHTNEYEAFTKQGIMKTCEDLKCIADFTKMPYDQLVKTIDRVNTMTGKGNDKDFNHRSGLMDMSQGQVLCYPRQSSFSLTTQWADRINEKAQALAADGKVIPGLLGSR